MLLPSSSDFTISGRSSSARSTVSCSLRPPASASSRLPRVVCVERVEASLDGPHRLRVLALRDVPNNAELDKGESGDRYERLAHYCETPALKRFLRSRMPIGHGSPSKTSADRQSTALLEMPTAPDGVARFSTIS